MANTHRGEIEAEFDGQTYRLCLTLGALAELEQAFGDEDMLALAARFESGRLKASDATRLIGAGLRGAGHNFTDDDVAALRIAGGAAGYVATVVRLLQATFGTSDGGSAANRHADTTAKAEQWHAGGRAEPDPFPGTR